MHETLQPGSKADHSSPTFINNQLPQAKPLIPWVGGKRRLAQFILSTFPEHTCYVEPFCGAAALFFLKPPVKGEVLNDINSDLVGLYRVVTHHLEEFIRHFKCSAVLLPAKVSLWRQSSGPVLGHGHHGQTQHQFAADRGGLERRSPAAAPGIY
jgi:hypothetical protein